MRLRWSGFRKVRVFFSSDVVVEREDLERLREAGTKESMRLGEQWEWLSRDTIKIEQIEATLEIARHTSAKPRILN